MLIVGLIIGLVVGFMIGVAFYGTLIVKRLQEGSLVEMDPKTGELIERVKMEVPSAPARKTRPKPANIRFE